MPTVTGQVTEEKRVSWAELFFDLVFVVAVTQVSTLLEHDHSWAGQLRALVVFVPIYWTWVGMAIQTNQLDVSSVALRLRMFAVALAGVFMALTLTDAYGDLGLTFACAYWVARLLLAAGLLAAGARGPAVLFTPYGVSVLVTAPLLVVGALVDDVAVRTAIWGVAAVVDLASPRLLRRRLLRMRLDPGHLAERFGLFVLIALGESVVAIGSGTVGHLSFRTSVAVVVAFAFACGLWWVYFHFAADAVRHALTIAQVQLDITRLVLSYGHLAFIAAVIGVAVGMRESIAHPSDDLVTSMAVLLVGGTGLYLAAFGFTRWAMFHQISWTRLGAAGAVLVVLPLAPHVPALLTLAYLAAVLAAVNALELRIVRARAVVTDPA